MTPPYTGPLIATFGWMRTCVVARARMSGASVSATKADAKGFRPLGRCERRGPCPSLVASVRRGRSMLAVELITRSSPGRAHRHHPSRRARVFRRVRRSAAYRRRRRRWLRIRHAIRERAGSNSTCPNRCGTLAGATVPEAGARTENARFTVGLLIATFRCAAPACCGASLALDESGGYERARLIQFPRAVRLRGCHKARTRRTAPRLAPPRIVAGHAAGDVHPFAGSGCCQRV
jgi:hypothetical protein